MATEKDDQAAAAADMKAEPEKEKLVEPETKPTKPSSGVAMIKPEYIDHNHVRRLVTDYLPASEIESIKGNADNSEKSDGEPPAKKAKLKGRNKARPREKRQEASERLCPAILKKKECQFGEKCKFLHDIKKYMESKPEDLGDTCYLYRTYGRCSYGLTCRFAKDHTNEDLTLKENEELVKKWEGVVTVSNLLDRDVQKLLWKRKYDFKRAEKSCQAAQAVVAARKDSQGNGNKKSVDDVDSTNGKTEAGVESQETAANMDSSVKEEGSAEVQTPSSCDGGKDPSTECYLAERKVKQWGPLTSDSYIRLRPEEKKKIDFSDKLYLAPLTTVGNLPFRRVCKEYGVDVTCGEMALATNLLQGQQSEWALLKRHSSEDLFGVQICGSYPNSMSRAAQMICENTDVDFIDINCGCPIDLIFKRGEGSALMGRHTKLEQVVKSMTPLMNVPLTLKMRTGIYGDKSIAHQLVPKLRDWGISMVTVHGRSREQRYTRLADWDYLEQCGQVAGDMPLFGNGDILSYEDAVRERQRTGISGLMIARGALIKPWVFTEIKEQRHWDISSSERLDMLRRYANAGLEHWGSDQQGISTTRRFLLEWLSFLHRYIPVGLLEQVPQKINQKPPYYVGRNDLETMMASANCVDWIKISEMLLGPVPSDFTFLPKHRANSYS